MTARLRILDANLNRAREGLRVLEDVARFAFDDTREVSFLKGLRHRLDRASRPVLMEFLDARDSGRDVGRGRDVPTAKGRALDEIVAANARRAQEALRSIEEAARGAVPRLAAEAHSVRYECYGIEKRLVPRAWRRALLEDVRLYVLADPSVAPLARARAAVAGGARMLQLRHKDATGRDLLRETWRLLRLGVPVIVNDRVDVAAEAHGVHLGADDLPIREARRILGEKKLIGATSHSLAEARRAVRAGADYISVGPMFATPLKPRLKPKGFRYMKRARKLGVPAFCIGGITAENARRVAGGRVAVCAGVIAQKNPRAAARNLLRALRPPRR
ncbi:MAG: thiamine phosphate synthase [Planctomycetota bacterium]|jgi:thiamine-phosphate pyrophosphorylase